MSITISRPDQYKGNIAIDHHTPNHAFKTFLKEKFNISQSQFILGRINFYSEPKNSFNFTVVYKNDSDLETESDNIYINVVDFFKLFRDVKLEFTKNRD